MPEYVIRTSVLVFLVWRKKSIVSFKDFVVIMVLSEYVP